MQLKWQMIEQHLDQARKVEVKDHKKESLAQNKLQTELGEINDELASYASIRERTGLGDNCKKN